MVLLLFLGLAQAQFKPFGLLFHSECGLLVGNLEFLVLLLLLGKAAGGACNLDGLLLLLAYLGGAGD